MKASSYALLTGIALLGVAGSADAQYAGLGIPLSIEARGGVAFPTGDLGDENEGNADTGFGFQVGGILDVTPRIGVYAGYSRTEFDAGDADIADIETSFIDSGLNAGVQLNFSPLLSLSGATPFVRGGLLYHTLDLDVDGTVADEIICDGDCDSDASLGFEVGGGLDFPLGRKVSVTPAVRYTSYEADFGDADDDPTISSVVLDVGLRIRL